MARLPSFATYAGSQPATLFQNGRVRLLELLLDSAREGEVLREPGVPDHLRFERVIAFGQFADHPPSHEERASNAGLFGTAAAIEALAPAGLDQTVPADLRRRALASAAQGWNFIDLAVLTLSQIAASKYAPQAHMTLRMAHVLRAAAAVECVLGRIRAEDSAVLHLLDPASITAAADYSASTRNVVQACLSVLSAAKGTDEIGFSTDVSIPTFRFVVGDDPEPDTRRRNGARNLDQAVYLTSSVLVSVVRAQRAGVCDSDDAARIVTADVLRWLVNVTLTPDTEIDPRFRLFACWALSHVTPGQHIPAWPHGRAVDDRLTPGAGFDAEAFAEIVRQTLRKLRTRGAYYVECLSDYRILRGADYGRDYFGIPVLPIVMVMTSLHDSPGLYRSALLKPLSETASALTASGSDVLPYQASVNSNGVVYLSYVIPALASVATVVDHANRATRVGHLGRGAAYDHPAVVVTICMVVAALIAAVFLAQKHPATLGVVIGIIGSLAANLFLPPLVSRIWGHDVA